MRTTLLPRGVARLLVGLTVGLALAACSNGSTPTTTTTTTTTLPSMASSTAAIKQAFQVLFDLANPALAPKLAVVQGGSSLGPSMQTALKSSLAKEAAGASISKVGIEEGIACSDELVSSPCAKVTYDILSPAHAPLLANTVGYAVYVRTKWLVAKATICTLLDFENSGKVATGCG